MATRSRDDGAASSWPGPRIAGHQSHAHRPRGQPAWGRRGVRSSSAIRKIRSLSARQGRQQDAPTSSASRDTVASARSVAATPSRYRATISSDGAACHRPPRTARRPDGAGSAPPRPSACRAVPLGLLALRRRGRGPARIGRPQRGRRDRHGATLVRRRPGKPREVQPPSSLACPRLLFDFGWRSASKISTAASVR